MSDVDFKECHVIKECLCYLTYDEFCEYRKLISKSFNELSENGRLFYKFYVYANIHMELRYKDAIWSFLNNPSVDNEAMLLKLNSTYRPRYVY